MSGLALNLQFYLKISSVEMDLPESGVIRQIFSTGRCAEISAKFAVPLSGESHLSLPTPPCVGNYDRICQKKLRKKVEKTFPCHPDFHAQFPKVQSNHCPSSYTYM
jgi:hypothetical protein